MKRRAGFSIVVVVIVVAVLSIAGAIGYVVYISRLGSQDSKQSSVDIGQVERDLDAQKLDITEDETQIQTELSQF